VGWPVTGSAGRRFLIATGTANYPKQRGLDDVPEVVNEIDRVERLFGAPPRDDPDTSGFGYSIVPGFGPDLLAGELKHRLRTFLTTRDRDETDTVIFYYTGHGQLDDDGGFLFSFPDTTEDVTGTAVPATELARWLLSGTRVQRFLIVLDTCYSAAAGAAFSARAIRALGRLQQLADRPHVAILTAARARQLAEPGAFTQALERAVRHRATGGHEPEFLQLQGVVGVINNDPFKPASQRAALLSDAQGVDEFLPNPRYDKWLRGFDLRTQLDRRERDLRDRETRDHVLPRAQGLDSPQEGLWLFTGRHAVLAELSAWLAVRNYDGLARIVTGNPGSGKSAVLARLHVLARPELRRRVPRFDELPEDTVPPRNSVDVFIHARGKTGDQVFAGLCVAAGVEAERPGELLTALRGRKQPLVAIIDALDEAIDPDQLAEEVLAPLIRGTRHTQLRLLLGTRSHLEDRLRGPAVWINLDSDEYADPDSIRSYARSGLIGLHTDSPYRTAESSLVDATAAAVGHAAGQSFLVALITTRSLVLRHEVVDPYDRTWQERLPRIAADAMSRDLDERLGAEVTKARDLLLPLAFAFGAGIPWADMWAPLASVLSGRTYTDTDLDWLERNAGYYVIEALDSSTSVYRLYHESLAEHLRTGWDIAAIHHTITRFLVSRVPVENERLNWSRTEAYVRSHFATHASAAGALDEFVLDPDYLLNAERSRLLAALPAVRDPSAERAAEAYRAATKHLRSKPRAEHLAYLELAAHCADADVLAARIAKDERPQPWRVDWAHWNPRHDTVLGGHAGPVRAVVTVETAEGPIAASSGDDGLLRLWDLTRGFSVGRTIADVRGSIQSLDVVDVGRDRAIVAACMDGTIRAWNLGTTEPIGRPQQVQRSSIRAMAVCETGGRTAVVTGTYSGSILVSDLSTGTIVHELAGTGGGSLTSIITAELGWRPIVLSGTDNGVISIWDFESGRLERRIGDPRHGGIDAMAVGELTGRPVLASGGAGGIQLWDMATGRRIGEIPAPSGVRAIKALATAKIDGRDVVVGSGDDNAIRQWDLATGEALGQPLAGHSGFVGTLSLGESDGRPVLVSGSMDSTVRLWNLGRGTTADNPLSGHLGHVGALATGSSSGREVVVSGADDGIVRVWDLADGSPVGKPMTDHTDWVRAVDLHQWGAESYIISGSHDRSVRISNMVTGAPVHILSDTFQHPVIVLTTGMMQSRPIVFSCTEDKTLNVHDVVTGERLSRTAFRSADALMAAAADTLDGQCFLAIATYEDRLYLWAPEWTKPLPFYLTAQKARDPLMALLGRDGRLLLATGDQTGLLSLWELPLRDNWRKSLGRRRRPARLKRIGTQQLPGPVTAIVRRADGMIAASIGDTVLLDPISADGMQIQVDARVRTMRFADKDTLVVSTVQGLVAIRLRC
jgi:WD40 repeat protein